jgi:hypothetical protein
MVLNAKNRKKSSNRKRFYSKSSKGISKNKSLISLIKKVTLKTNELKYKDTNFGKAELYHNVHYNSYWVLTDFGPSQGVADDQRIGNQINMSGVKITMMFYTKADRPNTKFRVIVYSAPYGSSPPGTAYGSLFDNVTGNVMIDSMNKDRVKVLKSFMVYPKGVSANLIGDGTTIDNKEVTCFRKFWIPYRTKVRYPDDGSATELTNRSIYVMIMAYDSYGTLVTDNVGAVQSWQRLYYRDP